MSADWTDADYGREDGRQDALAGRGISEGVGGDDAYAVAYRAAYDQALSEIAPENIRQVD
ncbi:hypothetical protein [Jatrophihabitans sp.]|uniref:hypothetical protein n=1 Tax=Jatrophihabitans sp. TaxID=1932789 RepID=UPI0030C7594E|nr:hypothetical protein [Jatrophihabitans sp.]